LLSNVKQIPSYIVVIDLVKQVWELAANSLNDLRLIAHEKLADYLNALLLIQRTVALQVGADEPLHVEIEHNESASDIWALFNEHHDDLNEC
jgi:hypothetical protein